MNNKDKLLCAYIKMNLLSKEIAPLLNISLRGVEISRYRLRKKLGLEDLRGAVIHNHAALILSILGRSAHPVAYRSRAAAARLDYHERGVERKARLAGVALAARAGANVLNATALSNTACWGWRDGGRMP